MPHTYASVQDFRDYMAGSGHSGSWSDDAAAILRALEAASAHIDQRMGRSFGPSIETRTYEQPGRADVALDHWLLALSSATDADSADVTAGCEPRPLNSAQKTSLRLESPTAELTVAGTWGWQYQTRALTTITEALDDSSETVTLASPAASPGSCLRIGDELLEVVAASSEDDPMGPTYGQVTALRGQHGTTAAAHDDDSAVRLVVHPGDVSQACLEIARNMWKERDAGAVQTIGQGGITLTRPGAEIDAILRRLDYYLGRRGGGGIFFR